MAHSPGNWDAALLAAVRIGFSALDVRLPDGRRLQRVGVSPDIEVLPTAAGIRAGRDEVLDRALEYLAGVSNGSTGSGRKAP